MSVCKETINININVNNNCYEIRFFYNKSTNYNMISEIFMSQMDSPLETLYIQRLDVEDIFWSKYRPMKSVATLLCWSLQENELEKFRLQTTINVNTKKNITETYLIITTFEIHQVSTGLNMWIMICGGLSSESNLILIK